MAEIISNNTVQKSGFHRRKKLSFKVDMTPMVDLGFLLITFFIFTSTLSQPTSMNLIMPKVDGPYIPIKESDALTILPNRNGKIYYYEGFFDPARIRHCSLKEIRNILHDKMMRTSETGFFVAIKPSENADYGHMVDVLDEMTISGVKRYALVDITPEEQSLLR